MLLCEYLLHRLKLLHGVDASFSHTERGSDLGTLNDHNILQIQGQCGLAFANHGAEVDFNEANINFSVP